MPAEKNETHEYDPFKHFTTESLLQSIDEQKATRDLLLENYNKSPTGNYFPNSVYWNKLVAIAQLSINRYERELARRNSQIDLPLRLKPLRIWQYRKF